MSYTIKNLIIEIPEIEDTKHWMKQHCDSHIASGRLLTLINQSKRRHKWLN